MNRLQKKCFIASAGMHLLLALLLVIGPAFIAPKKPADDMPVLDFIPLKTVDALVSGGGNPNAKPPPAALAAPPPAPAPAVAKAPPEKIREPDPPRELKQDLPDPDALEPAKDRKRKIEISTKPVVRSREARPDVRAREEAQARERAKEQADARRRVAQAIGRAADRIEDNVSGSTTVELKGPGGGGIPYANFLQAVKSAYARAWTVPDGVTDDDATAVASVTIARDGTVVEAKMIRASGNSEVDHSVRLTLQRVRYAAPLPDDAKENQRTVTINFNVRAQRLLG